MSDEARLDAGALTPDERMTRLFDALAPTYDAVGVEFFVPIAARLVELLGIAPGDRVADLGCGKGAFLMRAAAAAGPSDQIVGLDVSPGMVAEARRSAAQAGLGDVQVVVGDAQAPQLPGGPFDVVGSSLVLFFLPDPAAALRAWHGLLAPGGKLGVATFGSIDPAWQHIDEVFEPYLTPAMLDARTSGKKGPFASDQGMVDLVTTAGFADVVTHRFDLPVRFADAEQWYAFTMSVGQRAHWMAVPEAERPAVRAEAERRLERAADESGGYVVHQEVRYTLATAATRLRSR